MEIVNAQINDVPEIISLLKTSLGEKLLPKTEEYFIWKHFNNPFGPSKILLAKEKSKIIGVRAFMYWKWVKKNQEVLSVRAVDTATSPDYQGKGIFKTLTMQAVKECSEEGVELVFNSPNPISMKGYLKMGWSYIGRMPIFIGVGSLWPKKYSEEKLNNFYKEYEIGKSINALSSNYEAVIAENNFHTGINHSYLKWRYVDCPAIKYGAIIKSGDFGMVFRFKKINGYIELRVCEIWNEDQAKEKDLKKALIELIKKVRPLFISCSFSFLQKENKPLLFFGPFKRGPKITLRRLAKNSDIKFNQFNNWAPSIGSIELF